MSRHFGKEIMVDRKQLIKGILSHIALFIVNFFVLVGIIESIQLFTVNLPFLNAIVLSYMLIHTIALLSIQLGIQLLELIKIRMPTFLVSYYFQFSDEESIPIPLLDPTKSKLAVLIILLVISGGPILYTIFAVYGFLLAYAILVVIPLNISTILQYFALFLFWMPPVLILIVGVLIISIVIVEFKHL
jgi:hypothetical protein